MSHTLHFLVLLPLILFLSNTCGVHGGSESPNPNSVYNLVPMDSLRPATTCSSPWSPGDSRGVKVMHRYGPCSPLHHNSVPPTSHQLFLKDQSRVDSINGHKSTDTGFLGAGNYMITVGLGTPEQKKTLIMDTGSDLTWVQCKPCSVKCYRQKEPIFDPSASSTYTSNEYDGYNISYGDKSYSRGHHANDTLNLSDSGTIPHFTFGCGQDNSDHFNDSAGMFGLSKGRVSIVSQTKTNSTFGQIFCYCLTSRENVTGYLHFGKDARMKCQTKTSTPLLAHPDEPQFYFVDLVGITIGTKRLAVSSFLSGNPNTVMDSGTVITRLPSSVYSALRAEFNNLMSAYPKAPPPLPPLLDTCYDLTGGHADGKAAAIPKMALHFRGADVALDWSGVVVWEKDSQVCLGFAHKDQDGDFNIIGSTQQKTLALLHNIPQNKLGFRTNAC